MLGECEKPSFYIDNCCFTALGILFVLTCASLFINIFLLYGQGGGVEREKEGDPFFDVSTGFKDKCTVVSIEHAE